MTAKICICAALAGLLSSGCCTRYMIRPSRLTKLASVEGGEIVEHYQARNYGWYLFNAVPLVCGDTDPDADVCLSFFSDQVRTDLLTEELNRRVRETKTRPVNVTTFGTNLVAFQVPGLSVPLVLPYVICYREAQISAVLVKKDDSQTRKEAAP